MTANLRDVIPPEYLEYPVDAPPLFDFFFFKRSRNTNKRFMSISFSSSKMLKQSSPLETSAIARGLLNKSIRALHTCIVHIKRRWETGDGGTGKAG